MTLGYFLFLVPPLPMRTTTFRLLGLMLVILAAPLGVTAQPASGSIEGRVFNAATGDALANARVSLLGTDRVVVADAAGFYRLTGVAPGEVKLSVAYLGMASQSATVSVKSGEVVRREFELVLERRSEEHTSELQSH